MTFPDDVLERFWTKVDKTESCWIWTSAKGGVGQYGLFHLWGRARLAHRISWEIHYGPIPKGEGYHGTCVLHHCDTPPCVNPEHLFLGTSRDNTDDALAKKRLHTKLTAKDVREIRAACERGEWGCQSTQARVYGVHHSAIYAIVKRITWTHI